MDNKQTFSHDDFKNITEFTPVAFVLFQCPLFPDFKELSDLDLYLIIFESLSLFQREMKMWKEDEVVGGKTLLFRNRWNSYP